MPIEIRLKPKVKKKMGRPGPTKSGVARQPQETMSDRFRLEQRRRLMNKKRDNLPGGMVAGAAVSIGRKNKDKIKKKISDIGNMKVKDAAKAIGSGVGALTPIGIAKSIGSRMKDRITDRDKKNTKGELKRRPRMPTPQEFKDMMQEQKRAKTKPRLLLTGGQAKIAAKAPPTNKIDGKDFAVLRAEKAKGRGMGLQDEKMKPGKVKKAVVGILAQGAKKLLGRKRSATAKPQNVTMKGRRSGMGSMLVELFKKKQLGTQGISGPIILGGAMKRGGVLKAKKGKSVLNAKQYRKYLKGLKAVGKYPGIRTAGALKQSMKDASKAGVKGFLERRAKLAGTTVKGIERAAKATRIGKIALGIAAAGLGAKEYLKRKSKKNKRPQKKMGGGMMMQRPIKAVGGAAISAIAAGAGTIGAAALRANKKLAEKKAKEKKKKSVMEGDIKGSIKPYVKKKMGGGMMMRRPMGNYMGGGLTEATQRLKAQGKMGGGMMMRPNPVGYKTGKSVKVKCKLGRNKPTKMY